MTTHPVTSGVELYSTLLQNTYLQASRGGKTPQASSQTSGAAKNSTTRFALNGPVASTQNQTYGSDSSGQTLVALNNATELQNVASTRQSFIELQQILEGTGQATPIVLELTDESTNPMVRFAARLYQSARSTAGSAYGDSVGTTFSATA